MITLEAIATKAPLGKLVEGKALMKLGLINRPIRINKNIAHELVALDLARMTKPGFYMLTQVGKDTLADLEYKEVLVPLDLYLQLEKDTAIAEALLDTRFKLWKLMVRVCESCKKHTDVPLLIEDAEGNKGIYCEDCLKEGYEVALERVKQNRHLVIING